DREHGVHLRWRRERKRDAQRPRRSVAGGRRRLPGGGPELRRSQPAHGHHQVQLHAADAIRIAVFPRWDRHDCYQHHEYGVLMQETWLRKQSGQAVVLVAIAVLALTAILALALDGGSIYLDKRQLQNAADSAALDGAERLMTPRVSYATMHNQAVATLLQNLPGTTKAGTVCSAACPILKTIGLPGGNGIGTLDLGAGYHVELTAPTSYTYQVSIWHSHNVVVAPIHGFQPIITLAARATAQNANLPYAVVLLQDKSQYATYSNFNVNGTPGGITIQGPGGSNPNDRGGIFSNASIAPGNGTPSITFSPGNNQADLWAVNESNTDRTALQAAGAVSGQ